jgi:hypothetical protein
VQPRAARYQYSVSSRSCGYGRIEAPPHVHPRQQEEIRVSRGMAPIRIGRETCVVGPGERLLIPAGTPHTFSNAGGGRAPGPQRASASLCSGTISVFGPGAFPATVWDDLAAAHGAPPAPVSGPRVSGWRSVAAEARLGNRGGGHRARSRNPPSHLRDCVTSPGSLCARSRTGSPWPRVIFGRNQPPEDPRLAPSCSRLLPNPCCYRKRSECASLGPF